MPAAQEHLTPEGVLAAADVVEKLARYMGGDCFDERRRSSRNQHTANKARTYWRKMAKRVLRFRPIAAAFADAADASALRAAAELSNPEGGE